MVEVVAGTVVVAAVMGGAEDTVVVASSAASPPHDAAIRASAISETIRRMTPPLWVSTQYEWTAPAVLGGAW